MAEHDFTVNFKVVRAQSEAAQKAEASGYRELEKIADKAAKSVEDTTRRTAEVRKKATAEALSAEQLAAKVKEELIRRENAARVKAAADSITTAKKEAEARKAAERDVTEETRKAAQIRADAARREAVAASARRRADAAELRAAMRAMRDDQIAAAKAVADAHKRYEREKADASKKANEQSSRTAETASRLVGVLGQIGNAAFGLNGVASVISAIADSFERARSQAEEAGKMAAAYRETLKELAALKGQNAPTAGVMREQLAFRAQTLQSAQDARALQEAFLNVSGVSTDTAQTQRRMSQETAQQAMVFAGQMQSRLGGDAAAYGALAGMIPTMEGKRVGIDDIRRRMVQIQQIGEKGGATPADFARQMGESSGLVTTGAFQNRGAMSATARMAAVGSALSITTPKEITTGLQQVHKITGAALFDTTPGPGAEMSPADYLASLGVTNQMDDLEILQKMFRDVEKAESEAAKKGETLNMTEYLKKRGLVDVQDTNRFKLLYGARADLEKTFMPMAAQTPTAAEAMAPFAAFGQSVQGMKQKSDLALEQQTLGMGIGAGEYYQNLQRQAFAIGQSKGGMAGSFEDWKGSVALQEEMRNIVRGEGEARGLKYGYGVPDEYGHMVDPLRELAFGPGQIGSREQQEAFYRRGIELKQAGGDPMGTNSPAVREWMRRWDEQMKHAVEQEKLLTQINNKLNPPAVGVAAPGGANAGPIR